MSKRHWKCKIGLHDWGLFYIERLSETFGWMCHKRDCTRPGCDRVLVHTHPPDGDVAYRREPSTRYDYLKERA